MVFPTLSRITSRRMALLRHSRIGIPSPMSLRSAVLIQRQRIRGYASEKNNMDELSKTTDYMHVQNILLQREKELSTRHTLLKEATGFFDRFKINTKWFLIRGNRPFSVDEISTIFSWLIISQIIWVLLGTTTFVSLVLFTFNTVFAKEMVGQFVGKTLDKYIDGCDIEFQDALVPEWKKGCIRFRSVKIKTSDNDCGMQDDFNQLKFDLKFNQIDLTLSVRKWLTGHGLIDNVTVFGMHGNVDVNENNERKLIKWFSNPVYHLGAVKVCDSCIALRDNGQNYRISIYNMDMNRLRFEWCVTDFLDANVVTGAINHSLFTIHKRQHKLAYLKDFEKDLTPWRRITRFRLDRISVKDLGLDKSSSFNWIEDGSVEVIADLMLPNVDSDVMDSDDENNKYMVMDVKFNFKDLKATFPSTVPTLSNGETVISFDELKHVINYINNKRVIFNSVATVEPDDQNWNNVPSISIKRQKAYPDTTVIPSSVSWPDGEDAVQLTQEIIKYHDEPTTNTNNLILKCRIVKNINELENVALFRESGVYDLLAMELYVDLMKAVEEWEFRKRNNWMRLWGTTLASQLLIFGLGAIV